MSITMERIVIEVTDEIAKRWRLASQQRRNEIAQRMNIKLAKELMVNPKEELKQFLDEVSATMKERGLSEEALQDILSEDD